MRFDPNTGTDIDSKFVWLKVSVRSGALKPTRMKWIVAETEPQHVTALAATLAILNHPAAYEYGNALTY
jgi:hypothetical protein